MTQKIIFITLAFLAITAFSQMPGGWNTYQINSTYKSDQSSPLYKAYHALTANLHEISDIKFVSVKSQIVNGMNFKITFTYVQDNQVQKGNCVIYVPFSGECDIVSLQLQNDMKLQASMTGGFSDYKIESGYKSDASSPLYKAYHTLTANLHEISEIKFVSVQSQVVNGINFKITFTYVQDNKAQKGNCVIYVPISGESEIVSLQLQNDMKLQSSIAGGFSDYKIESGYKSDASSPLYKAYHTLTAQLHEISEIKFVSVQSQVVNGMNFKITFTYVQDNKAQKGNCVIYVPFSGESEIVSLQLQNDMKLQSSIAGGFSDYKIESGYKSDASSPLYKAYNILTANLHEISEIKFVSVQSQVVNGMNFKITFTYVQDNKAQKGNCVIYVPFSGESEIVSLQLQNDMKLQSSIAGGFSDYKIESGYKSDASSPLYKAYHTLSTNLHEISEIKFVSVQSQVVNGMNFKITFTYVQDNKAQKGNCVIYVPFSGESEIVSLQLQNDMKLQSSIAGGFSDYKIESGYKSDASSPLYKVYHTLTAQLHEISEIKFVSVQSQVVNGVNFKITFTYVQDNKAQKGNCVVYVPFSGESKIVSLQLQNDMKLQQSNVEGAYTEIELTSNTLKDSQSFITISYKMVEETLKKSNLSMIKVMKVEQQVVGGVNVRFSFLYRENMKIKVGSCVVYGQPWMNNYEVVSMHLDGEVQIA